MQARRWAFWILACIDYIFPLHSSSPLFHLFFCPSYFHLLSIYLTTSMLACFKFQQTYFKHCQILMGRVSLCMLYHRVGIFVDQKLDGISYLQKKVKKKERKKKGGWSVNLGLVYIREYNEIIFDFCVCNWDQTLAVAMYCQRQKTTVTFGIMVNYIAIRLPFLCRWCNVITCVYSSQVYDLLDTNFPFSMSCSVTRKKLMVKISEKPQGSSTDWTIVRAGAGKEGLVIRL